MVNRQPLGQSKSVEVLCSTVSENTQSATPDCEPHTSITSPTSVATAAALQTASVSSSTQLQFQQQGISQDHKVTASKPQATADTEPQTLSSSLPSATTTRTTTTTTTATTTKAKIFHQTSESGGQVFRHGKPKVAVPEVTSHTTSQLMVKNSNKSSDQAANVAGPVAESRMAAETSNTSLRRQYGRSLTVKSRTLIRPTNPSDMAELVQERSGEDQWMKSEGYLSETRRSLLNSLSRRHHSDMVQSEEPVEVSPGLVRQRLKVCIDYTLFSFFLFV